MEFFACVNYFIRLGFLSFVFGRILPRRFFSGDKFPYRPFKYEQNGRIYEKTGIKKWKDKVPDMSKLFPSLIPRKKIEKGFEKKLPLLISETCIAEFVHASLAFLGFKCMELWQGLGGFLLTVAYFLGNLVFVVIQRYNRPRLVSLYKKMLERENAKECENETAITHTGGI